MAKFQIEIDKVTDSRISQTDFDNLIFGELFSDHQLEMVYENGAWQQPKIKPYAPVSMYPAVSTFHYGQAVFEGMKAYRYQDTGANIFRIHNHFERFNRSCRRVCIPEIPHDSFVEGLKALIDLEREWVPKAKYKSLYIRPIVYASDQTLGLRSSKTFRFHIICSPVGNYYAEGIKPIRLTTMPEYVRAVKGGVGEAKVPGNYAASLEPTFKAQEMGYTQVLWLDAIEHRYVEEVGSMNIFFVIGDTLVTPALSGSILPGVTRDSVLELAQSEGMKIEQRPVSIDELMEHSKSGKLREIFGSGTAAVISPVGMIHHQGNEITVSTSAEEMGPVAKWFYDQITGIQHGEIEDKKSWCTVV
ncbi:branched-chain amino acid aminotransferase [Balneolales bacterium ANBcel1]|nr:branched-chain amino acid aminotransferase [Balneolales bacterium ANBcel1]